MKNLPPDTVSAGEIPIKIIKESEFCFPELTNRINESLTNNKFPDVSKFRRGIPQGSILGPLLFNIFVNDIFMTIEQLDICNFADDNTLYSCGERLKEIKENLVSGTKSILNWFRLNSLKTNPGKFQFMILGDKSHHKHILKINSIKVQASDDILLLGITIDKKLTFKQHIENLCRKAQYKLYALRRIRKFLTIEKAKILGNAFIDSLTTHRYYGCFVGKLFTQK